MGCGVGWPRVWRELVARGMRVGKEGVRWLMQTHSIKACGKRKFVVTTDSRHDLPVAENLLARDFTPAAPDQVWSSDITYVATSVSCRELKVMDALNLLIFKGLCIEAWLGRSGSV